MSARAGGAGAGAARSPYEGVLQILRFNWPWYGVAVGLGAAAVTFTRVARPSAAVAAAILSAAGLATFWSLASLWVSHLVYDRSKIADGTWIDQALPSSPSPSSIASFHAGLDETSARLSARFPSARLAIFDFYDPASMTEASIRRARRTSRAVSASVPIDVRRIPLDDRTQSAAFVVFAAHELRDSDERILFFREVRRVLEPEGNLVVVEHVRDGWNLLAFGPGALHFLPRGAWLRAFRGARLELLSAHRVTPFVTVFRLRPAA
jgi:hypothetical protein